MMACNAYSASHLYNSPVANAVLKNSINLTKDDHHHQQLRRMEDENRSLQLRLHNRTLENGKLQQRIEKIESELLSYRKMLESINHNLTGTGQVPSINLALNHQQQQQQQCMQLEMSRAVKSSQSKKSKKAANHQHHNHQNCQCCDVTEKPHLCDFPGCGKRFRQKPHLQAHKNIHSGRRFNCQWVGCGKSFVRKYNLVEHQKMHSPVQTNMCTYPECGKVFSSKYSLVRHQNAQHSLQLAA